MTSTIVQVLTWSGPLACSYLVYRALVQPNVVSDIPRWAVGAALLMAAFFVGSKVEDWVLDRFDRRDQASSTDPPTR